MEVHTVETLGEIERADRRSLGLVFDLVFIWNANAAALVDNIIVLDITISIALAAV